MRDPLRHSFIALTAMLICGTTAHRSVGLIQLIVAPSSYTLTGATYAGVNWLDLSSP
jgi:hypothetical protein